jgi:hypothetical protein
MVRHWPGVALVAFGTAFALWSDVTLQSCIALPAAKTLYPALAVFSVFPVNAVMAINTCETVTTILSV